MIYDTARILDAVAQICASTLHDREEDAKSQVRHALAESGAALTEVWE